MITIHPGTVVVVDGWDDWEEETSDIVTGMEWILYMGVAVVVL